MNRDEDLNIEDEYSGDLVEKIKKQLDKKGKGTPTRFLYDRDMPRYFLRFLTKTFDLKKEDLVAGGRYHNLNDLMKLPNPLKPDLEYPTLPPLEHPALDSSDSIFAAIEKEDQILHFPYHSYDNVLRFFNEAAIDPEVDSISVTLYRIANQSLIANALISAAFNGKKVTVFVEVKARFDEENNLYWAQKMEGAGIRIIYSIPGLKVHAKVALVIRKTGDIKRGYAYLGTGNFNESTATIYADHGLFTTNQEIVEELGNVFRYLYKKKVKKDFEHLLVSQFNMKEKFLELIDKEIEAAKIGEKSGIIIKLNNLEQKEMIEKLYEASRAGVTVQIIVRGICCLTPGVEGLSENIKVMRIIDRFLEHARVFIFQNNGNEKIFLSSADWMHRNLDRRVEVGFPIYQANIKEEIKKIIDLQLNDNTKAVSIDRNQKNLPCGNGSEKPIRAQMDIYEWLLQNVKAT
jgi:polyphosphate kinase